MEKIQTQERPKLPPLSYEANVVVDICGNVDIRANDELNARLFYKELHRFDGRKVRLTVETID